MSMRSSCWSPHGLVACSGLHAVRSQPFCLAMSEREGTDDPPEDAGTRMMSETSQPTPIQVVGVADLATTIRTMVNESLAKHSTPRGPSVVVGVIVYSLPTIFSPPEPTVKGYGLPPGLVALGRKLRPWGESSGSMRRGISVAVMSLTINVSVAVMSLTIKGGCEMGLLTQLHFHDGYSRRI